MVDRLSAPADTDVTATALPGPMIAWVVDKQLIGNTARLRLMPEPHALFSHHAGQYLHVVLADGKRQPFSIANAPVASGQIELHMRRGVAGDFSTLVFGPLAVGDLSRIKGDSLPAHHRRKAFSARANRPMAITCTGHRISAAPADAGVRPRQFRCHVVDMRRIQNMLNLNRTMP